MGRSRKPLPRGIRERHSRACNAKTTGRCSCVPGPSYQVRVWSNKESAFRVRSFPTLTAAEEFQKVTKRAVKGGVLVAERRTVRDAGDELLERMEAGTIRNKRRQPFKPSVTRAYRQGLDRVYPHIGAMDVRDVKRRDVQRMVDELETGG